MITVNATGDAAGTVPLFTTVPKVGVMVTLISAADVEVCAAAQAGAAARFKLYAKVPAQVQVDGQLYVLGAVRVDAIYQS